MAISRQDSERRAAEFERQLAEACRQPGVRELMELTERFAQAQRVVRTGQALSRRVVITTSSDSAAGTHA